MIARWFRRRTAGRAEASLGAFVHGREQASISLTAQAGKNYVSSSIRIDSPEEFRDVALKLLAAAEAMEVAS